MGITYDLPLVRPPDNSFIVHRVLSRARTRNNLSVGDFERIQDTDYSEGARVRALFFRKKFSMEVRTYSRAEVRGMQRDRLLKLFDEEHVESDRWAVSRCRVSLCGVRSSGGDTSVGTASV